MTPVYTDQDIREVVARLRMAHAEPARDGTDRTVTETAAETIEQLYREVGHLRAVVAAVQAVRTHGMDHGRAIDAHVARGDSPDVIFYAGAQAALEAVRDVARKVAW